MAVTVILAFLPLLTELVVTPKTSPTEYPLPAVFTVIPVRAFPKKVKLAVAPVPDPVIL